MNSKALCILALVAAAIVASDAAYCHTSSYQVASTQAVANKSAMFKACLAAKKITASPMITKVQTMADGCVVLIQKVDSEAAWNAYSDCEKSKSGVNNQALYGPLDAKAKQCADYKKTYPSKAC